MTCMVSMAPTGDPRWSSPGYGVSTRVQAPEGPWGLRLRAGGMGTRREPTNHTAHGTERRYQAVLRLWGKGVVDSSGARRAVCARVSGQSRRRRSGGAGCAQGGGHPRQRPQLLHGWRAGGGGCAQGEVHPRQRPRPLQKEKYAGGGGGAQGVRAPASATSAAPCRMHTGGGGCAQGVESTRVGDLGRSRGSVREAVGCAQGAKSIRVGDLGRSRESMWGGQRVRAGWKNTRVSDLSRSMPVARWEQWGARRAGAPANKQTD
jgi:hypothetical protein